MNVPSLLAYLLALLVSARPSGHIHDRGCWDAPGEYEARVARHIDAAATQVYDIEIPPLVQGPWAHEQSLVHVLAVAHHESFGWCRAAITGERRGDHGASGCAMGLMSHRGRVEGWTLQEVIDEPALCYLVGYQRMRLSWPMCGDEPTARLRVYASGQCGRGSRESRDMMIRAWSWWGLVLQAWKEGKIQ